MNTSRQVPAVMANKSESLGAAPRQRWRIAEKQRIVEEALVEGASVARVARAHGINANQVFGWRRLYREQQSGSKLKGRSGFKILRGWVYSVAPIFQRLARPGLAVLIASSPKARPCFSTA
jgi:transposase-like protein